MAAKQRLGVSFPGVAHGREPAAAAFYAVAPGDRVIGTHRTAGIGRLVNARQDVNGAARIANEVVPLVGALPIPRQTPGGRMVRILDMDHRALDSGVVPEPSPDQPTIPRPVMF